MDTVPPSIKAMTPRANSAATFVQGKQTTPYFEVWQSSRKDKEPASERRLDFRSGGRPPYRLHSLSEKSMQAPSDPHRLFPGLAPSINDAIHGLPPC